MDKEFLNNYFLYLKKMADFDTDSLCNYFGNHRPQEIFDENFDIIGVEPFVIEEQYEIVNKPKGEKQELSYDEIDENGIPEEYQSFLTHEYCDQYCNGGYSGDEFAGNMYFPLPTGQYMRIAYQC